MKIVRSTKCSAKFATKKKKYELNPGLKEYGKKAVKQKCGAVAASAEM